MRPSRHADRIAGTVCCAALLWAAAPALAQQFLDQTSTRFPVPNPTDYTNQCTIGDLDGDTDLDIVWANANGFSCPVSQQLLRVYINNGSGTFTDETAARTGSLMARARGVELGDIEGDGDLDIIVAQDCSLAAILLVNNGSGVFTNESAARLPSPSVLMSSSRAQFGDSDNDGDMDLFFCNGGSSRFGTGPSKIFENDGTGHFTDVSGTALAGIASVSEPMDLSLADVDGDYDIDFVVAARSGLSRLYKNDGDGTFTQVSFPADGSTYSFDFGDINSDGDLDLVGANNGAGAAEQLLINNGSGVYTAGATLPSSTVDDNDSRYIDYDDDGDLDIFVAHIGGSDRAYLNSNGAGTYTLASAILPALSDSSLDLKVADLTGDGAYDCITAEGESGNFQNRIYINTGPADTFAPLIPHMEQLADTEDSAGPYVVRVQVTDHMTCDRNFHDKGIMLNYQLMPGPGPASSVPMKPVGGQVYRGEIPGQSGGSQIDYWVTATDWNNNTSTGPTLSFAVLIQCKNFGQCADVDQNGVRDDGCVWWACNAGECQGTAVAFADMGGEFGACLPDGFADANDRFHALNCFSNLDTTGSPPYPCEPNSPNALNVDAGGPTGDCNPDGVCDANDAFHALNAFDGSTSCSCGSPAPSHGGGKPVVVARTSMELMPSETVIRPGATVQVDVRLSGALPDLRGYQLHLGVSGGQSGSLELIDILVGDGSVFSALGPRPSALASWQAFNISTHQMLAGLDGPGIAAAAGGYLATFIYRASPDASGTFTVDVLHDGGRTDHRTFLFATPANGKIAIESTTPAVITVGSVKPRRERE